MENELTKAYLEEAQKQFLKSEFELQMKKNALAQLRAYQDLIYGDCLRDKTSYHEVMICIDTMKKAFNIQTATEGCITKEMLNGRK